MALLKVEEVLEERGSVTSSAMAMHMDVKREVASLALMRLHRMGFLKRAKVVRRCHNRSYTRYYNRGYQYRYSLSKQGVSYLRWYRDGRVTKQVVGAFYFANVFKSLPPNVVGDFVTLGLLRQSTKFMRSSNAFNYLELTPFPLAHYISLVFENSRLKREANESISQVRRLMSESLSDLRDLEIARAERDGYRTLYHIVKPVINGVDNGSEQEALRFSQRIDEMEQLLIKKPVLNIKARFDTAIPAAEQAFDKFASKQS